MSATADLFEVKLDRSNAGPFVDLKTGEPVRYPKFESVKDFAESGAFKATSIIYDNARKIASELTGKNIPAKDLTNEQKCALFTLAGLMKYQDGKLVSVCEVGIADRGDGTYIIGAAPGRSCSPHH